MTQNLTLNLDGVPSGDRFSLKTQVALNMCAASLRVWTSTFFVGVIMPLQFSLPQNTVLDVLIVWLHENLGFLHPLSSLRHILWDLKC
jgi:hypothetical protein